MNQVKYIGDFKNNGPDGYGTAIYSNGSKFVGYFKQGIRSGLGMEIRKYVEEGQERIRKGLFEGDSLVGPNWANHENLSVLGQGSDEAESGLIADLKKEGQQYYSNNLEL